jgi:hypothetical protein
MRGNTLLGLSLLLLGGGAVLGCARHEQAAQQEERRKLLAPPDNKLEREEAARKRQIYDEDGDLIPSEDSVAGLTIPRGMTPGMRFEHEWYFSTRQVPSEALERYFSPLLLTGEINRSQQGTVEFVAAHVKANATAPRVTVRIVKLKGEANASEVYIRQAPPTPSHYPSEAEVEAQLKARREHAE